MCTLRHSRPVVPKLLYTYLQWYSDNLSVVHSSSRQEHSGHLCPVQAPSRAQLWPVLYITASGSASAGPDVSPVLPTCMCSSCTCWTREGNPACWSQLPSPLGLHGVGGETSGDFPCGVGKTAGSSAWCFPLMPSECKECQ